jgi:dihydropteroate synthase
MRSIFEWNLSRTKLRLGERTAVMGILNVTPDSFSDGGKYMDRDLAVSRGEQIEQDGADLIDVGGESSRPGSIAISEDEELRRVAPVIEVLASRLKIPISIDTYRSRVALKAVEAGAQIVNDISAFRFDPGMAGVVLKGNAGVVLMHSRGSRETLHTQSRMVDPLRETLSELASAADSAKRAGIAGEKIVIDPGIGFGKAASESLSVLKSLELFSRLGYPVLVGTSRKSFIRSLIKDSPEARNWGTAATIVAAITKGSHIVRVHDIRQARALADVADRLM